MPATVTREELVNAALSLLGSPAITSLDSDGDKERACVQAIKHTEGSAFASNYDWSFARRTRKLQRIDRTPENGFRFAHEMPGDSTGGPIAILLDSRVPTSTLRDYSFEDGLVTSDFEEIWCVYPAITDPAGWPGEFRTLFETLLASNLAIPIGHDPGLADYYKTMALGGTNEQRRGGLMGAALAADAHRKTLPTLDFGAARE